MKKLIVFAVGGVLAGSCLGQGNISAPTVTRHALPPVNSAARTEGGLQRGVRLGNPLQMFSPFAPAEYGQGRELVTARDQDLGLRPRDRSRAFPIGLRLISFAF
jgi:hypothetical protein